MADSKDDVLDAMAPHRRGRRRACLGRSSAERRGEEPEPSEPEASEDEAPDIETYLRAIFDRADVDKSGEISTKEAIAAVENDEEFARCSASRAPTKIKKEDGTRADLEFAIAMLDADGNEKVSWGEFREAFLGPLTEVEDPFEDYLTSTRPTLRTSLTE